MGPVVETLGGVVERVTVRVAVDVFPAVSVAVTVIVLDPAIRGTAAVQTVVPVAVPLAETAGLDQLTLATATLSLAVPPMESGLEFVKAVPEAVGVVMVTVGATESCRMVIVAEVEFPDWSEAVTVTVLSPATRAIGATLHDVVPVTVPTAPLAAFTQVTVATPTLSEAVPLSAIEVAGVMKRAEGLGREIATAGGTVSSVTVIVEGAETFPAMSVEVTVRGFAPLARGIEALHDVVPEAVPDPPVAALDHWTEATPRLSAAVPPRRTGPTFVKKVAPAEGAVIATVGGVAS